MGTDIKQLELHGKAGGPPADQPQMYGNVNGSRSTVEVPQPNEKAEGAGAPAELRRVR